MPKQRKQNALSQAAQSARFVAKCRELEAAGELNPIEAEGRVERVMQHLALKPEPKKKTATRRKKK